MQKFTLIASVADLGLFGSLATSLRRLTIAAAVACGAVLAYAFAIAGFVSHMSRSVELNLVLITAQFFLVLGAAYVTAMCVGAWVFGDAWRRRTFLGERKAAGAEDDIASLRDYSMHFYGIFGLALASVYGGMVLATGDYVGTYNREGYYATLFRSESPERRIQALRALVDPVHEESAQTRLLREHIAAAVEDPDDDVAAWAAWAAGWLNVLEAAPALSRQLETGAQPVRIEAAIALGRMGDPAGERRLIGMLPSTLGDPELAQAVVTGIGLMPSLEAVPALTALLGTTDPEVEVAALWAIGRARTTSVREPVLAEWENTEGARRCAYAELLKHVTTVDDYDRMRELFRIEPDIECERRVYAGRQYDEEHPLLPVEYVVGEELRLKYVKAAFNIGGPGLEDWLVAIAWAEDDETDALRIAADRMATALRESPSRLPRQGVEAVQPQ